MALLTFTDSSGRSWRVWNVERAGTSAGRGDYLEPQYREGWLVFESTFGNERRRLPDFPVDWATYSPAQLEALCQAASPAARHGATESEDHAASAAPPEDLDAGAR
jgi:hypothetical protein